MDTDLMINKVYADSAYVVSVNNVAREKISDTLYVCQFQPGNNDSTDSYHLFPNAVVYEALKYFDYDFNKNSVNLINKANYEFMADNFKVKIISNQKYGLIVKKVVKNFGIPNDLWLYKPNGGLYNSQWKGEQVTFEVTYKNKVFKVVYNLKPQYPEKVFESEYDGLQEYVTYCGKHKYLKRGIYISSNNFDSNEKYASNITKSN